MPDYNYNLKQVAFNPIQFKATQYTPQTEDLSITERSLERMETRKQKAIAQQSAVDIALQDIEKDLNEAESAWFVDYKNNIRNQIQKQVDAGNYGDALTLGVRLAGEVAQDTRIAGRKRAQASYKAFMDNLTKLHSEHNIGDDQYAYLKAMNTYSYEDNQNSKGQYTMGADWKPNVDIVKDLSIPELAMTAFQMVTADKGDVTKGNTWEKGNSDGSSSGGSKQTRKAYERKSATDIMASLRELIAQNSNIRTQVERAYDVAVWGYNEAKRNYEAALARDPNSEETASLYRKYKAREADIFDNGSIMDYDTYISHHVVSELQAKNLAYDWQTTSTITSSSNKAAVTTTGTTGTRLGSFNLPKLGLPDSSTIFVKGPVVGHRREVCPQDATRVASAKIDARFNTPG